jgi:hypothetical protein
MIHAARKQVLRCAQDDSVVLRERSDRRTRSWLFLIAVALAPALGAQSTEQGARVPAVPLVTHDPYFSIWSPTDKLTDSWTMHWTGAVQQMWGMARIDGKTVRLIGPAPQRPQREVGMDEVPPAMRQTSLEVTPTRSIYRFEDGGVRVELSFLSPLLPADLEVMSRPVTYLTWTVRSIDGGAHDVALYFDASAQVAVNSPEQAVAWSRVKVGDLQTMRVGTAEQPVLGKDGDNLRIDWGYFYIAVPPQGSTSTVMSDYRAARTTFARTGALPEDDDLRMPRPVSDALPVLATVFVLGRVDAQPVSRHLLLAYDDVYSVELLQRRLRPYWRRNGADAAALLRVAERDYPRLVAESERFDAELTADLRRVGGDDYAQLAALAFRQTIAAHKLAADFDGSPLYFSKENFSNGSIATVDVTYPSSPFFLLFNPALLEAQLRPVLDYAASSRWPWPYAPHDLGRYPLANGQRYGGGERTEENQMPVEESGNMLLMLAALARAEGDAHFADRYGTLLQRWAEYLRTKGFDPENQLSTDDFAGHLAHNANLSVKAILALGSYAMLGEMMGKKSEAATYRRLAEGMAAEWARAADDGSHYRLAFDKPGSWSQKYNLVWDRLLGLDVFPGDIARKEIAFYKTVQNPFGLPLDNRESYTKLDWIVWTATLAESPADFRGFIAPLSRFLRETPDRVPLTDWYGTTDAKKRGFQARSVVGGVYVKMLADPEIWRKWRSRSRRETAPRAAGSR